MELIHVIEIKNGVFESINTFANIDHQDSSGSVSAEKLFKELIEKDNPEIKDIDDYWEDGYYEGILSDLYLTHSWLD